MTMHDLPFRDGADEPLVLVTRQLQPLKISDNTSGKR